MTAPVFIDSDTLDPDMMPAPTPSADDLRSRTPGEPASPEAPFGWMKDRKTKQIRPRKSAGQIRNGKPAASVAPPANRAAAKPRTAPAPAALSEAERTKQAAGTLGAVWYLAAMMPSPPEGKKVAGRDLAALDTRIKASAALLKDHTPGLSAAAGMAAKHSTPVARVLDSLSSTDGPAWVIPVLMAVVPFAGAMAALWKAPVEQINHLAERTRAQAAEIRQGPHAQAAADEAAFRSAES